jgi:hypothetical protein
MSVYKHKDSPFYHFDFQWKGDRFYGSTGTANKREAEGIERLQRRGGGLQQVQKSRRNPESMVVWQVNALI